MENKITIDIETLKKIYPVYISLGIGLGLISGLGIRLGGISGTFFLFSFIFCGAFYAKLVLEKVTEYKNLMNLAVNGAIFTLITALVYEIITSILIALRYETSPELFSLNRLLEAATVGALGAIAWYAYKKNEQEKDIESVKGEIHPQENTNSLVITGSGLMCPQCGGGIPAKYCPKCGVEGRIVDKR